MHMKSIFHYFDLFKWKIEGNHELLFHMGYLVLRLFDLIQIIMCKKSIMKEHDIIENHNKYSIWLTNTWKITEARKEVAIHYTLR